ICCLENAVTFYNLKNLDWSLLFEFLWRFPTGNEIKDLALWHENEGECVPFCIMDELPYEKSHFEFISKEQYEIFKNLYSKSNNIIWTITDSIHSIGTQYLYSGVGDGAPETLKELEKTINLLNKENIPLPNFNAFRSLEYEKNPKTDWIVWGDRITPESLSFESKWIIQK
ncbi:hypothetical protein ACJRPK_17500, partial [Aquimarina sp. 2-A2]|uniref:hypothetical protein n=1 Tax=Aquimarina sp. 2-A2 TaxID=3382644 RepID=UPI00387F2B65